MKYCSKHISHGNSVKRKNSASRHRRIHQIKRPEVVLKFTTSILGGWPGLSVGLGNGQLSICSISQPSLLAKSGSVPEKHYRSATAFLLYLVMIFIGKCISKIMLKKLFMISDTWISGLGIRSRQRGVHIKIPCMGRELIFPVLCGFCHSRCHSLQRTRKLNTDYKIMMTIAMLTTVKLPFQGQ